MDYFFLPSWPPEPSDMIGYGTLLLLAVLSGELFKRYLRLPPLSGYVAAGVVLSLTWAPLWSDTLRQQSHLLVELAFGLLLFELGQRIDLGWLRRNPWLLATSLAESALAFLCIGGLLWLIGTPLAVSLLAAGLSACTGPVVVLGVSRDCRARGQITDRLHLLTALGCCYSFVLLGVAFAWQHGATSGHPVQALLHPLYLFFGAAALGTLAAYGMRYVLARVAAENANQTLGALATIVVTVGLAHTLKLSPAVTLLCAGILVRQLDQQRRLQPLEFGLVSRLALIVICTATGALFAPSQLASAIVPAIGLIAARALGKTLGVFAFARPSGLPWRKASLLSIGLLPMSGVAMLWVEQTAQIWPNLGAQLAAIVLSALVLTEIVAPLALQFALRRGNESLEDTQ